MAKCRPREKELRRRRHRYWKRKKQRIKQAIMEARMRKLAQQQAAEVTIAIGPAVTESAPAATSAGGATEVSTSPAEPVAPHGVSMQDAQPPPSEF